MVEEGERRDEKLEFNFVLKLNSKRGIEERECEARAKKYFEGIEEMLNDNWRERKMDLLDLLDTLMKLNFNKIEFYEFI